MKSLGLFFVAISLLLVRPAFAKRVQLKIGEASPKWDKVEGIEGRKHSLTDLKARLVVILFTCDDCPIAQSYASQLVKLHADFVKRDVVFVAINPNKNADLKSMRAYAEKHKFEFLYLHDKTQEVAKSYGALRTPEVFLLGKDRKLEYVGAIDDAPPLSGKPTKLYLRNAIESVLADKKPTRTRTRAVGCAIRWK